MRCLQAVDAGIILVVIDPNINPIQSHLRLKLSNYIMFKFVV